MSTRTKRLPKPRSRKTARRRRHPRWGLWAGLAAIAVATTALALAARTSPDATEVGVSAVAPDFQLAATDGSTVSLAAYRGRDVVLYFNEGVGCDACFAQLAQLEANGEAFRRAGLTILPIVVNSAPDVRAEADRFGIRTPFLLDNDRRVSIAYEALGQGMHADLPGHGFVLVDSKGKVRWRKEYPTMYVSTDDLLAEITAAR